MASRIASLAVGTTRSLVTAPSMSPQSVTTIPSQPSPSLSQPVINSRLTVPFTPFTLELLVMMLKAPSRIPRRKGANCFSRSSS